MAAPTKSRYTVCWTLYLTAAERAPLLRWARWAFPVSTCLTPGQLICHALEQYGRRALHDARAWCDTHPEEMGWEAQERRARPACTDQGGGLDGEL